MAEKKKVARKYKRKDNKAIYKHHIEITDKLAPREKEQFERFYVYARFKTYLAYNRLFECCRTFFDKDPKYFTKVITTAVRGGCVELMRSENCTTDDKKLAYELYKKTLLSVAQYDFDSFMLYMEINIDPKKSFWLPRRDILMPLCINMQKVADKETKLLIASLPPRVGKSGLMAYFIAWVMGKNPQYAKLYVTYGSSVSKLMYDRVLTLVQDKAYTFKEIFPQAAEYTNTSAQETTIDLGQANPHKTLATRSIDGSITGVVEAKDFLFLDDLIKDIEEAMKPERLDIAWEKLTSVVFQRLRDGAAIISFGTRWSINDPNGRLAELYKNDPKCSIINIPALNEKDESNFMFKGDAGFSTEYYHIKRKELDPVSFAAIYMGEPIEREGLLFQKSDLNLTGTKKEFKDESRRCSVSDVAWGGGDFTSMPCCWVIKGDDKIDYYHIKRVVHNNGTKDITQPLVAGNIVYLKLQDIEFEANNGGDEYADNVAKLVRKQGWICRIKSKKALNTQSKVSRIIQYSTEIKDRCIFLKEEEWDDEYKSFMNQLMSFNQNGKNKHDDAADALARLIEYDKTNHIIKAKVLPPSFKLF